MAQVSDGGPEDHVHLVLRGGGHGLVISSAKISSNDVFHRFILIVCNQSPVW